MTSRVSGSLSSKHLLDHFAGGVAVAREEIVGEALELDVVRLDERLQRLTIASIELGEQLVGLGLAAFCEDALHVLR